MPGLAHVHAHAGSNLGHKTASSTPNTTPSSRTDHSNPPRGRPPVVDALLEGPPPTTWHDFKHPTLRQFPRHGAAIRWLSHLGSGRDGNVFKVEIGPRGPFALKIFWKTLRPEPMPLARENEWALKDECRTAALLEKIKWAMEDARADPDRPIEILRAPKTAADAVANLRAFCDETRDSPVQLPLPEEPIPRPAFPPLPVCHGWTTVARDEIPRLSPPVIGCVDAEVDWHWAIVYEFVPGEPQDKAVGQAHLDFFYALGFALEAYKPDNWRGGRLVDLNDICSPFTPGWSRRSVYRRDAEKWFWTLDFEKQYGSKHTIVHTRREAAFSPRLPVSVEPRLPAVSVVSRKADSGDGTEPEPEPGPVQAPSLPQTDDGK